MRPTLFQKGDYRNFPTLKKDNGKALSIKLVRNEAGSLLAGGNLSSI